MTLLALTTLEIRGGPALRRFWLAGTIGLTIGAIAVAIALAPAGSAEPGPALRWLLFVGSSVHVAATAWFYSVPEIRRYAWQHRRRFVVAPLGLIAGAAFVAALVPPDLFTVPLLAFFAWQFFHFQKQNLGIVALAGVSRGVGSPGPGERKLIVATGLAGTAGLLAHPELLQLAAVAPIRFLFPVAGAAFAVGAVAGLVVLWRRPRARRPATYVAVYLMSLLFFLPVFVFGSPYAAVAGLTIAHGYQYLLILGLVAGADRGRGYNLIGLAVLVNVALLGGLALNAASHTHGGGPLGRALFGAYLGLSMAHFVVDAGLWRLREEFPRRFLTERLPYLLQPDLVRSDHDRPDQPPHPPAAPAAGAISTTNTTTVAVTVASATATANDTARLVQRRRDGVGTELMGADADSSTDMSPPGVDRRV